MQRLLTRITNVYHYDNDARVDGAPAGVRGDLTDVQGDLTDVQGSLTGVRGDLTGVRGDLRRCNCDGSVRPERTKLVFMTSGGKRRTSRRSGVEKRTRPPLSFGTRLSRWHDTRRGCLL